MKKTTSNDGKFKKENKIGKRFSKDYQPSPEAKSLGRAKAKTRADLPDMIFDLLTGLGTIDKAMVEVSKKVDEGKLDELIKLLQLMKKPDKQEIDTNIKTYTLFEEEVERKANELE